VAQNYPHGSEAGLAKAIEAELDAMAEQSNQGREPTLPKPKPKPKAPAFKLRGAPDSEERWEQAVSLVDDPEIVGRGIYDRVIADLRGAAILIQQAEERGEEYDRATIDAFATATRHLAALQDPQMYSAFEEAIAGSEAEEHLGQAVAFAEYQQANADRDAMVAMEQDRLDKRQQLLAREYEIAAKRHGDLAVSAVDGMVRMGPDTFYSPALSDDEVRALARKTADQVHQNQAAVRSFPIDAAITEEMIRQAPPGSSWNDAERDLWETNMRQTVLDNYQKKLGDPDVSADRAIRSMIEDDKRAETGKGAFERALDAELDEMYTHSRQGSPHLQRLADQNAAEWEATHDELGRRTTGTDALGRESERRGDRR
jgi:hypothetical protein